MSRGELVSGVDALSAPSTRRLLDDSRSAELADPLRSRALATQARTAARRSRDRPIEAEATYRLGSIAFSTGNASDAFNLAVDARDMARACGAGVVEAWSMHLLGIIHLRAGNHSESLSMCLGALERYRQTGHRVFEGQILAAVASVHHSLGDTDRAIETYEAALTANQGLERHEADAVTLANIADVRCRRGEYMLAITNGEFAMQIAHEHAPDLIPQIQTYLGTAYASLGHRRRAESLFAEAIRVLAVPSSGTDIDLSPLAAVYQARGAMYLKHAEPENAIADLLEALDAAQGAGDLNIELEVHTGLAEAYKALHQFENALAHQELRFEITTRLFNEGADLRIQTLQVIHDTEAARQHAEILNLRTTELEALVRGRTAELEAFQLEALERLAILGEFRDTDTGEHTVRVGDLSGDLARELAETISLDEEWCDRLRFAARLHDIGKVAIPDSILLKPGRLTDEEFEIMKTHTTVGAQILSGSNSPLVQLAEEVALNHHERWDGTGYPRALAGEMIPLSGRITTVADVFDALTSARPYKRAWSEIDAATYILQASGSQFDPLVVEAYIRVMARRYPHLDLSGVHVGELPQRLVNAS